jgi:hypothetical protein
MNQKVLVSVHGYAGDRHQIEMLMPVYRHHGFPIVIVSPEDSKIEPIAPWRHHSIFAGERAYIGQKSWTRQHLQMKRLLDLDFDWILMNDSDSFCFSPPLPDYLFEDKNILWANKVDDFRRPGETWTGGAEPITWPIDYHAGHEICALQPPYFCSREALQKMADADDENEKLAACPICPFIDWYMVIVADAAPVRHERFRDCVSCETETEMGLRLVGERVATGAIFVHAVKRQHAFDTLAEIYRSILK